MINQIKDLSKAIIFLVVVCFVVSCEKDEFYSCDPDIDTWVKSNLVEIRDMTRADWLAIGDNDLQRAAFIAFTPDQKRALWIGKMEEVLTLDWTEQEREHLQYILEFLKVDPFIFLSKSDLDVADIDELDLILYKWEEYAKETLGWDDELLYNLVYTAKVMNINKEIDSDFAASPRLKDKREIPKTYCSCNTNSDCRGNGKCWESTDLGLKCTQSEAGCGLFHNNPCYKLCHTE